MDESIIKELAEAEVNLQGYEWRPKWKSLFHYRIAGKITDLSLAIKHYKSLTDEQIQERVNIHYWENAAWGSFDILLNVSQEIFRNSISPQDLAKKEINNIELLLQEGKCQTVIIELDSTYINDIFFLYEKLLTGQWANFFMSDELVAYEEAYEANQQEFLFKVKKMLDSHKKLSDDPIPKELLDEFMQCKEDFQQTAPQYIQYFNKDWVVSMQIQALVWYKEFLKKVQQDGVFNLGGGVLDWVAPKEKQEQKLIPMKLIRDNDGYSAMVTSFESFESENKRVPSWSELMNYMAIKPPKGVVIVPTYAGKNVSELSIENVNNPIDRDAFRKRYNRYFKKMIDQKKLNYKVDAEDIVHTKVYF